MDATSSSSISWETIFREHIPKPVLGIYKCTANGDLAVLNFTHSGFQGLLEMFLDVPSLADYVRQMVVKPWKVCWDEHTERGCGAGHRSCEENGRIQRDSGRRTLVRTLWKQGQKKLVRAEASMSSHGTPSFTMMLGQYLSTFSASATSNPQLWKRREREREGGRGREREREKRPHCPIYIQKWTGACGSVRMIVRRRWCVQDTVTILNGRVGSRMPEYMCMHVARQILQAIDCSQPTSKSVKTWHWQPGTRLRTR